MASKSTGLATGIASKGVRRKTTPESVVLWQRNNCQINQKLLTFSSYSETTSLGRVRLKKAIAMLNNKERRISHPPVLPSSNDGHSETAKTVWKGHVKEPI